MQYTSFPKSSLSTTWRTWK